MRRKFSLAYLLAGYSAIEAISLLLGYGVLWNTRNDKWASASLVATVILGFLIETTLYPLHKADDPSFITTSLRGMILYSIPVALTILWQPSYWLLGLSLTLYIGFMVRAIWRVTHMEWVT